MRDIIGVATAIVVLAGVSVAIANGGNTAKVIEAFGNSFGGVIKAATLQR